MREKFISLLSKQPEYNRGEQGTKINIHIPIRGEANKYCLEINELVRCSTKSDIDFSPNSFQIPHITLYMGYVSSDKDYDLLMHKVYEFSLSISSTKLQLRKPYLKEPNKNYLFVDTYQSEELIKLKTELKSFCGNLIKPLEWDLVAEIPHITLAYVQKEFDVIDKLIPSFRENIELDFNAIEVSYCGARGSCIGAIRVFELQES